MARGTSCVCENDKTSDKRFPSLHLAMRLTNSGVWSSRQRSTASIYGAQQLSPQKAPYVSVAPVGSALAAASPLPANASHQCDLRGRTHLSPSPSLSIAS